MESQVAACARRMTALRSYCFPFPLLRPDPFCSASRTHNIWHKRLILNVLMIGGVDFEKNGIFSLYQIGEVTTGDPVFYYVIRDSKGNQINHVLRTLRGVVQPLTENGVITEHVSYQFENAGLYSVSAIAEISFKTIEGSERFNWEQFQNKLKYLNRAETFPTSP